MQAKPGPAPAGIIQQIARTAGMRRLDAAAIEARRALSEYPEDPRLAALAGAIEFQRGQFTNALPLLQTAQAAFPADLTIRCNLIETLYHCGKIEPARALCDDQAIDADKSGRTLRLGAFLAQEAEDHEAAAKLYRRQIDLDPKDWPAWNNLGNAMSALGRPSEAVSALKRARELEPESAPIGINLANALFADRQADAAEAILRQMAEADPADSTPHLTLFSIYREQGREDDSYAAIAEAARRSPGNANVHSDYAQEAAKRNDYAIAEREFEAALAIDRRLGPSFVGMASMLERMNREAELEPLAERARANGVDPETISYIDAMILRRAGNFEAALAALDASKEVVVAGRRFHLRGILLDRLGRHDEAFAAFQAMNQHWLADPTRPKARARIYRDAIDHDAGLLNQDWLSSWSAPPAPDGRAAPLILLGFPRSGTTLLDTMLMREPTALVMEEEPFITELELSVGGVDNYPGLSQDELRKGRDLYFDRVSSLGVLGSETLVVDKHPLHLNKVATIQRFFPDARYILALRHPCDALLSCFLTNFRVNNAMSNFLTLEDAAATYDLTFNHWEKARAQFDLPVATVVYERLVEDTARELRPLFDWLGLNWPGDDHDHREAARARGVVHTASYAQVTEPIYQRARGRWHNYREHLAPILETMRPWVEKYGYSLEDGRIPDWPDRAEAIA